MTRCFPEVISLMGLKNWLYRSGRPNWLASLLNRFWAVVHAFGIAPNYLVTLEVRGRRSGRKMDLPLVIVILEGDRYLVSMLGAEANWVRNVKAATSLYVTDDARRCILKRLWRTCVPPLLRPT